MAGRLEDILMTNLTDLCQSKSIHDSQQYSVSTNEINAMIVLIKHEIVTAIQEAKPDVLDKKYVIEIIQGVV